jgi:hypothetical protein
MPRPKQSPEYCGLGNVAIVWKTQRSTPQVYGPTTQGGAARLRRLALPWANLRNAFGVKNSKKRDLKNC